MSGGLDIAGSNLWLGFADPVIFVSRNRDLGKRGPIDGETGNSQSGARTVAKVNAGRRYARPA
jgi:hypothetical protein